MTAIIVVVEKLPGEPLWHCTLPDGSRRESLTAVEVQELARQHRATCLHPVHADAYEATKVRCLALARGLAADGNLYCAPDREGEEPPEGTITPSKLRRFLEANGIPGCVITFDREEGALTIDPPLPMMQFMFSDQAGAGVTSTSDFAS